jgi:transcription initiation factor TFIIIB Brf1 subunit/transcription initiation factor TFIIB
MDDDQLFKLMETIDFNKECKEITQIENMTKNTNEMNEEHLFCTKCNTNESIITDNVGGIIVCSNCGTVITSTYDMTIEQKAYSDDTKGTVERCSGITNAFLPQTSLGTTISGSPYNRLKKLQQWSAMPYKEKSLYNVLKTIQTKCRSCNILKCIEDDAKILYKNISESKHESGKNKGKVIIIRGINRQGLIAACVFYACKRKGKSKGPKEIAILFDLKYKDLTRGCKIFKKLLKMKYIPYDTQVAKPEHYIFDYCGKLNLSKELIDQATKLSINIQKLNVGSTHTPVSVAIGSILIIMKKNDIPINKNQIATKLSMSAVTVSKTQKEIVDFTEQHGELLFNDELVSKLAVLFEEEKKNMKMPEKFKLMHNKITNNSKFVTLPDLMKNNGLNNYIDTKINESNKLILETNEKYSNMIFNMKNFSVLKNSNIDIYINTILNKSHDSIMNTNEEHRKVNLMYYN